MLMDSNTFWYKYSKEILRHFLHFYRFCLTIFDLDLTLECKFFLDNFWEFLVYNLLKCLINMLIYKIIEGNFKI